MNKPTMFSLIRSVAGAMNQNLQGKKRWVSLAGYVLLAVATASGFPLKDLASDLALDPGIQKDSTLIAIFAAAAATFRVFQNMGRSRDLNDKISKVADRLDRKGIK